MVGLFAWSKGAITLTDEQKWKKDDTQREMEQRHKAW